MGAWNQTQSLLISCGDDRILKSWWFDESLKNE